MKTKTNMVCLECEHCFKKTIREGTYEVRCPKCHGYDTDVDGLSISAFSILQSEERARAVQRNGG